MRSTMITGAMALTVLMGAAAPTSAAAYTTLPVVAEPTVDEVFDACVKAIGGKKAIDAIKSLHTQAKMSTQGMEMTADWKWSKEGGRLMTYSTPLGEFKTGTDGKVGWNYNAMMGGYMLATDEEMKAMDDQAGLHMAFADPKANIIKEADQLQYLGVETFNAQECHKIYQLEKDGSEGHMFFSVDSGLPVGFESLNEDGVADTSVTISQWKTINDVKFFHELHIKSTNPQEPGASLIVDKIEVNSVNESEFALPDEVKELAKNKAASDASGGGGEIKLSDLSPAGQAQAEQMLMGLKQAPGVEPLKQTLAAIEASVPRLAGEQKKTMEYVVQEIKKEIKARGG